jgi:hypothetical protein
VGQFLKLDAIGGATLREFSEDSEAQAELEEQGDLEFVLPPDHVELSARLEASYSRRGFDLSAHARWARRSEWEAWGLRDPATGELGEIVDGTFVATGGEPVVERYTRWGANAFKEWYLPRFQKVRASVDWLDGADLDRFSRYSFGFFGDDRLSGFSGSGLRFDDGIIGRAGYAFNVLEVIRFDASVERAWVDDESDAAGRQSFTGLGLGGSIVGPWKTVISISYGRALESDVSELEDQQDFLLFVFKLF